MDAYSQMFWQSPAGRAAAARRSEEVENKRNKILESIPFSLDTSKLPFNNLKEGEDYFSRLRTIIQDSDISAEERQYFVDRGVTEEFLRPNKKLWYDRDSEYGYLGTDHITVNRLKDQVSDYVVNELDYSEPHNREILKTALKVYHQDSTNLFKDKILKLMQSPEDAQDKQGLIRAFAESQDELNDDSLFKVRFYENYSHLFSDGLKDKICRHVWLNEEYLSEQNHQLISSDYHQLTGKNINDLRNEKGASRFQKLWKDVRYLNDNPVIEINNFYLNDYKKLFDRLPEKNSENYVGFLERFDEMYRYSNLYHKDYPEMLEISNNMVDKLYAAYGLDFVKDGRIVHDTRLAVFTRLLSENKLDAADKKAIINSIDKYNLGKVEPFFAAEKETAFSMNTISHAIYYAKENNADLTVERAAQKPYQYDSKAKLGEYLTDTMDALNSYKDYLAERPNIKNKILNQIKPFIAVHNFEAYRDFSLKDYLDFAQNYSAELPVDTMIKEAAEYYKRKQGRLDDKYLALFKKQGFKTVSPESLITYGRHRNIEVNIDDKTDLSAVDFNQRGYFAPDYHTSYKSKTTFLNEMCIYGRGKEAAIALNHGADPFLKNEFALGKKQGMPFPGMFRRDAKDNYQNAAKFMKEIAANLDAGKTQVLDNIWKSLGQDLRSIPAISTIIKDTTKAYKTRDFAGEEKARKEAEQKAAEQKRLEQERLEQQRKAEQERREKEAAEQKRREDMQKINENIKNFIGDGLVGLGNVQLAEHIAFYLSESKDELPVIPNKQELEQISTELKEIRDNRRYYQKQENDQAIDTMHDNIEDFIHYEEIDSDKPVSAEDLSKMIEQNFAQDPVAGKFVDGFIEGETAYLKQRQEEAAAKIKALKNFDKVAAEEFEKFFNNPKDSASHGHRYFSSVGKARRSDGYDKIAYRTGVRLGLLSGSFDEVSEYGTPSYKEFSKIREQIIDFQTPAKPEENAYNDFSEPVAEPVEAPREMTAAEKEAEKAKLKLAKKNAAKSDGKQKTVKGGLEALAALKGSLSK